MPELMLYIADYNFSSWSLRPWLAMRQSGLAFTTRQILLDRADTSARIGAVSPSRQLPCLLVDGKPIWDSLSICEYAAEHAPLWPRDPLERANCRSVAAEMHSGFRALPLELRMYIAGSRPTPTLSDKCAADVTRILSVWETCREQFADRGPYLFGDFTIADAMYAPVVTRFTTYDWPVSERIAEYMSAVWQLPAMREWRDLAFAEVAGQASEQ